MHRSAPLNRSLAVPGTIRDLTVGLVGAIMALALTLYQNLSGTGKTSSASLQQSLAPIHQQLTQLLRRLRAAQMRAVPSARRAGPSPAAIASSTRRAPRGTFVAGGSPGSRPPMSTTFPAPRGNLSQPLEPSFRVPEGWREISNLDSWMEDDSWQEEGSGELFETSLPFVDSLDMTSSFASMDYNYHPEYNREVAELERSDQFRPVFSSSARDRDLLPGNVTRNISRTPPPKRVAQLRQEAQPRRQIQRQRAVSQASSGYEPRSYGTFSQGPVQRADGTYAVRETANVVNLDGSTSRVSRTVSGPDVSILQNLKESLPPISGNTTYST